MDNENKNPQNSLNEAELEEKVLQDVSEKIRDAAAELNDEIAEAEETADGIWEETEAEDFVEEAEPVIIGYDEEGNPIYAEEELPEPKKISMKMLYLILSLVGAAVIGAILCVVGIKVIPQWVKTGGSSTVPATPLKMAGEKVASVNGTAISDQDMEIYIYQAAQEFLNENGGLVSDPQEYDWSTEVEDGKTAEEVVKENAMKQAIEAILLAEAGEDSDLEWDEELETKYVEGQIYMTSKTYGTELFEANVLAQGYRDLDQYKRMMIRESYLSDITKDLTKNPDKYYPDVETLSEYAATEGATVKHILISKASTTEETVLPEDAAVEGEAAEGEEAVTEEPIDKKILAEEILKKVQEGGDFDALIKEFGEDPGQPEEGYTFGPGAMVPEFEEAAFALGLNEISEIVETVHGYHIIKRIPGEMDLVNYWKANAKIKTKQEVLDAISIEDVIKRCVENQEKFQELYTKYQEENPSTGMGY